MKTCIIFLVLFPALLISQTNWYTVNPEPQVDLNTIYFFNSATGIVAGNSGIILRTIDDGLNWVTINSGTTQNINDFYFINNTTGYAVGDSGLILFTINSGTSWIERISGTTKNIYSLKAAISGDLYATCDEGTLLRSTDGGNLWNAQVIAGFKLKMIELADENNFYICGDSNRVLKTTNAGAEWLRYIIGESPAVKISDIEFLNINTGFAASGAKIYRTVNAGVNWVEYTLLSYTGISAKIQFLNNSLGYTTSKNGPFHITTNSGLNWHVRGPSNLYPYNQNTKNLFVLDSVKLYFCGTGGQILKSTSGGNWVWQIGGSTGNFVNFSFYNSDSGILTYENSVLFTSDGGNKWKIESDGFNNWFEPTIVIHGKVVFSSSSNGYYIKKYQSQFGNSEFILRSTNGGLSFAQIGPGSGNIVTDITAIENSSIAIGIIASAIKGIYRSDNGAAWVRQHTFPTNHWPLKVSFSNSSTGVVCGYISGNPRQNIILRTTNSGNNWSQSNLPNSNNILSIEMTAQGYGYLLCDSGIIVKSTDFGTSWFMHLSANSFRFKSLDVLDETHAYAVTAGNQMAFSSNGGLNWSLHDVAADKVLNSIQFINTEVGYISGENTVYRTSNGGLTFISVFNENLPGSYSLSQNYPNPFNPVTNIRFDIPVGNGRDHSVKLVIYDLLGKKITTLLNQQMQPGSYNVDWDASNFSSGVYFYRIEAGDYFESKKMVLIK